jgi:hypothetical protein
MRKLAVFNHVTLDGYFVDGTGGMNWAHAERRVEWVCGRECGWRRPAPVRQDYLSL